MAKKFLIAIFSVLFLVIPSLGQTSLGYTPAPSAAYCIYNGGWIPMLTSSLANPVNYTPPPTALFAKNGSSWYGVACDSSGNVQTTMGNYASAPATCSTGQTYFNTSNTTPYYCSATNVWTAFASGSSSNATSIQGIPVSTTPPTTGQTLQYGGVSYTPTNGAGDPASVQIAGNWGGFADFWEHTNNPAISPFGSGWCAGSIRDASNPWWSHGSYYMLVTCAAYATSPYNPTIGIVSSTDMQTWTQPVQVITTNSGVADCAGAVFSPNVLYSGDVGASTGLLTVYVSCTNTGAQWYSGPIYISVMQVAAGLSWTSSASYVWQNSGNPELVCDQAWEGCPLGTYTWSQGVYSPDVIYIAANASDRRYVMYYSNYIRTSSGAPRWQIGIAYASNPVGPWTKTGVPFSDPNYSTEEPAVIQYGNNLIMLTDNNYNGITAHTAKVLVSSDPTGLTASAWITEPDLTYPDSLTWSLYHTGSPSVVQERDSSGNLLPTYLLQYNGQGQPEATSDARTVGFAEFTLSGDSQIPSTFSGTSQYYAMGQTNGTLGNGNLYQDSDGYSVSTIGFDSNRNLQSTSCYYCLYKSGAISFGIGQGSLGNVSIMSTDGNTSYDSFSAFFGVTPNSTISASNENFIWDAGGLYLGSVPEIVWGPNTSPGTLGTSLSVTRDVGLSRSGVGTLSVDGATKGDGLGTIKSRAFTVTGGTNVVYRCTTAGTTLPIGALTTVAADCGASVGTSLTVN